MFKCVRCDKELVNVDKVLQLDDRNEYVECPSCGASLVIDKVDKRVVVISETVLKRLIDSFYESITTNPRELKDFAVTLSPLGQEIVNTINSKLVETIKLKEELFANGEINELEFSKIVQAISGGKLNSMDDLLTNIVKKIRKENREERNQHGNTLMKNMILKDVADELVTSSYFAQLEDDIKAEFLFFKTKEELNSFLNDSKSNIDKYKKITIKEIKEVELKKKQVTTQYSI